MKTAHFVEFFSPGTFVSEVSRKPIESWDTGVALAMAANISERHNAKPYGFQFLTKFRNDDELDSREVARSPTYFFGVKIRTLAEVAAENDPNEEILHSNMRTNGWERVVTTTSGWKCTLPLGPEDVVLDT